MGEGGRRSGHAGAFEEGVETAHDGGGFDVGGVGEGEGLSDEGGGEAQGAELGVDDDAGDGAQVAVDEFGAFGWGGRG